jgi:hypothetical protein
MADIRESKIQALLAGNAYEWAVEHGYIRPGESLRTSEVLRLTRQDVVAYLETHPVPGLDIQVGRYQGVSDGPKWRRDGTSFSIGWQDRGAFFPEHTASSETELRRVWIKYLAGSLGLAA